MTRVALQPCADDTSQANLQKTVNRAVPFSQISNLLGPERQFLEAAHPQLEAPMWGSVPHREAIRSHDALRPGDRVLFGRLNRFFLKGTVGAVWRNPEVARALWGERADGQTWELMYSLTALEPIDTPYELLNSRWEYRPAASPRYFRLLNEARSTAALDFFETASRYLPAEAVSGASVLLRQLVGEEIFTTNGSINKILAVSPTTVTVATAKSPHGKLVPIQWVDEALSVLARDGSVEATTENIGYRSAFVGAVLLTLPGAFVSGSPPLITLRKPDPSVAVVTKDQSIELFSGPLKRPALVQQRGEQGPLRNSLLGSRTEATCAICGNTYPVQFLWAAHIKKRGVCSEDERRDIRNVAMLACLFGCDALFEQGYISVNDKGRLMCHTNTSALETAVRERLEMLRDRAVPAHTPSSAKYFRWHRENTFLA